jgi:hypothetical protein
MRRIMIAPQYFRGPAVRCFHRVTGFAIHHPD